MTLFQSFRCERNQKINSNDEENFIAIYTHVFFPLIKSSVLQTINIVTILYLACASTSLFYSVDFFYTKNESKRNVCFSIAEMWSDIYKQLQAVCIALDEDFSWKFFPLGRNWP